MELKKCLLLLLTVGWAESNSEKANPRFPFHLPKGSGPWVRPTVGQVWPQPQLQQPTKNFMILRPDHFQFQINGNTCDILEEAIRRYYNLIFFPVKGSGTSKRYLKMANKKSDRKWEYNEDFRGYLDTLNIQMLQPCENFPSLDMDEHYEIKIDATDRPKEGLIVSPSVWGILRGLETFSQLIYPSQYGFAHQINSTLIMDFPRFPHRGLLLDTSRHFLPLSVIKDNLDLMAHNKMNVFHWHLTDDPSFPYESKKFPSLSRLGSFNPYSHVYSFTDIHEIIEYARLRGIRVIPEFDTPGHTQSWGPGSPGLLTRCYKKDGTEDDFYGPINPVPPKNYKFLKELFAEIFEVFPDLYVHLGGDEVDFGCWASNPEIKKFMESQGWGEDYARLEQYFMQRLINVTQDVTKGNMQYLVWQEVIDNNVKLPSDTVIHVWKDGRQFHDELSRVTKYGYRTILSSPWYLNYLNYGVDWDQYYVIDPQSFNGTESQKRLVIGGEACMWGEFVDGVSVTPLTWPRASAVAERLWSNADVNNVETATSRIEEQRCRLLRRGFNVNPINGVSYCDVEW